MHIQTEDAYSFGRYLLTELFSVKEIKESVIYATKKSSRPPLDLKRIDFLMGMQIKD